MTVALLTTAAGAFALDLESGELEPSEPFEADPQPELRLPRLLAAAQSGSTLVALVDARPPLLVSYDGGSTWRESGRGLPPGRAVALSSDDPDLVLFAARNRLYLSRDGARFWSALDAELPEIEAVVLRES